MSKYFLVTFFNKMIVYMGVYFLLGFPHLKSKSILFAMDLNSKNPSELLLEYAQSDETLSDLENLLKKNNLDINLRNEKKQTILHIAALKGAESIVAYLLDVKPDQRIKTNHPDENYISTSKIEINAQDEDGYTALHLAIKNNHLSLARRLLETDADLNLCCRIGGNSVHALHIVAEYVKDKEFITLLIDKWTNAKLDIDAPSNPDGITALMYAVKDNRPATEALLKAGALITQLNAKGFSVLHYAGSNTDEKFLRFVIQECKNAGLDINARDFRNITPLVFALTSRNKMAVKEFLKEGARVGGIGPNQRSALYYSICMQHELQGTSFGLFRDFRDFPSCIHLILETGVNLHELDNNKILLDMAFDFVCLTCKDGSFWILVELLPWYIYQIHTISDGMEYIAVLQSIKNKYLYSQEAKALRQAHPLLNWMFTELVGCTSKKQLIEKILQYLETAHEEKQPLMTESMEHLLLKEDILMEFNLHFKTFKESFSSHQIVLEKLKNVFRYLYAQKLQKEIFSHLPEDFSTQLRSLEKPINNVQSILHLKIARDLIIEHCQNTAFKSPLLNDFLVQNDLNKQKKIIDLATCFLENSSPDGNTLEKSIVEILNQRINTVFELVKNVRVHLDHLTQEEGTSFIANSKDILQFAQ